MKLIKRLSVVVVLVVIIAACVFSFGKPPQAFENNSISAAMLQQGPFDVASFTELLVDKTRPTQANGDAEVLLNRSLDTDVWYPVANGSVAEGRHPLLVFSHGFTSLKKGGTHIGQHLASYGYIVVAASFPLTNYYAQGGPMVKDVVNQPRDVSFLIDTLLQWSNNPDHILAGHVDAERIGATGISLGGMTTTMAAFHPDKRDPRIKAAASIAGPLNMFGPAFFASHNVPFLMLATDQDALVDYQANARPVLERISGAQLVTVAGASHTGFTYTAKHLRWLNNPDSLGCEQVLKNVDLEEEPWLDLLGSPEQGIIVDTTLELCTKLPLPPAMNPLRQHMLVKVSILSFFQSYFAEDAAQRDRYALYLSQQMAAELEEIRYEKAAVFSD